MSNHIDLMPSFDDPSSQVEDLTLQVKELKAIIKDIESTLVDMLISDKTHRDRDIDLKHAIREIRGAMRSNGVEEIPF
jgi:hypothetical protein